MGGGGRGKFAQILQFYLKMHCVKSWVQARFKLKEPIELAKKKEVQTEL